jgi:uncharacterized sulfatase
MTNIKHFCTTIVTLTLIALAHATDAAEVPKPNVLFILVDDLGWHDVGCYGEEFIETPSIDRLASDGMRFTDAYASSPVCAPSRASIVSGQSVGRHDVSNVTPPFVRPWGRVIPPPSRATLRPSVVSVADMLNTVGYQCVSIGKHGRIGLAKQQGFVGAPPARLGEERFDYSDRVTRFGQNNRHKSVGTHFLQAVRFIEDHRDEPFFCYLNYRAVHEPLDARDELIAKYRKKAKEHETITMPLYAAMTEVVDESVGLLMEVLEEHGLTDRTLVVFTSDNGGLASTHTVKPDMSDGVPYSRRQVGSDNKPLRAGKGTLYEGGTRVPLIVHLPGRVAPGSVCRTPVIGHDFYPTFAELADAKLDPDHPLDGVSLVPLLEQSGQIEPRPLFWTYPDYHMSIPAASVRTADDWKLIEFYGERLEVYNLREDPYEQNNLAAELPERTKQLHATLKQWRERVNAAVPKPNPQYDPEREHIWGKRAAFSSVP